jgi:hypothetical protein
VCLILFPFVCGILCAQQDTTQKAEPEMRRLDIPVTPVDSTEPSVKSRLPKFDLPEYVITGDASISMPALQKGSAPDDAQSFTAASLLNAPSTRTRSTAQAPLPMKETTSGENELLYNGTAFASLGTFFTPKAGLWYGRTAGDYQYSFDGHYDRSKGFAPFTDRSGGSLAAGGGTTLKSDNPNFDQAKLRGDVEYRSDTYNWYGTSRPSMSRNRSNFALSAWLSNWGIYSIPYSGTIGVNSFQVSDSTADVSETTVRFDGATRFNVSSVPLNAGLRVQFGTVSRGNSATGLAFADAAVSSQRYDLCDFSLEGSLHGYLANGMGGQRLVRLYPHLDAAYLLNQAHILRGAFGPEITASSLSSALFSQRYLSAGSEIRHVDDQLDGALSLESEWTSRLSTKFEARAKSIVDYPLYADSGSRGVWFLAYGGKTTIATISGEIFAKLPANDYFASDFIATVSHTSATGSGVPYLPGLQLVCRYGRQFAEGLRGVATLTLIHVRKDNVVNIADLPSILLIGLRGRYQVLPQAELFLDIENLLNQTYEYWRGYQENPFVISAGVSIRW